MAKTRKPSRKELKKDDEFVAKGQEVVAWATQYSRHLIAVGVGLVVIVAASIGAHVISSSRAQAASVALGAALEIAERPVVEPGEGEALEGESFPSESARREAFRDELEGVREDHRGTAAGALATLYLGKIALEEEELDEALDLFEAYTNEAPRGHTARFSALEGIGAVHEARGDLEAALDAFSRLVDEAPSFYVPFAMLHEARVLEALERHEEARAAAQEIVDEHGATPASRQAREILGRLPPEELGPDDLRRL